MGDSQNDSSPKKWETVRMAQSLEKIDSSPLPPIFWGRRKSTGIWKKWTDHTRQRNLTLRLQKPPTCSVIISNSTMKRNWKPFREHWGVIGSWSHTHLSSEYSGKHIPALGTPQFRAQWKAPNYFTVRDRCDPTSASKVMDKCGPILKTWFHEDRRELAEAKIRARFFISETKTELCKLIQTLQC